MNDHFDLWFVIEVEKGDKGILDQVYLIEPGKTQFYRVRSLHEKRHFQIDGDMTLVNYLAMLENKGLVEVESHEVQSDTARFYTYLGATANHFLPGITVVNSLPERVSQDMFPRARLSDWAEILAEASTSNKKKQCDIRGCVKLDIGFAPQSYRDPNVIQGMNAPYFTTKHNKSPGLDGEKSTTASMIESAIIVNYVRQAISDEFNLRWDDDFNDDRRKSMFASRAAEDHCILDYLHFIFEGVTIGVTGVLPDGRVIILNPHKDKLNGTGYGYDVYYSMSTLVVLTNESSGEATVVRVSIGCYGKKSVDDFFLRLDANEKLYAAISEWKNNHPELFYISSYLLKFTGDESYRLIQPRADKKLFYSIYIEGILRLGKMFSYDLGVLFEAVYLMTMSPSPLGWYYGVMAASRKRGSRNIVEAFVDHMVLEHGCVSSGEGRRRQVSHRGIVTRENVYRSLANMHLLATESMNETNTVQFVRSWSGPPTEGGVYGAKELISQEQIYVLACLGVLKYWRHAMNAQIAKGTETYSRLKEWDIKTDTHRAEIIRYVCIRMSIAPYFAENLFCEFLRYIESKKKDGKSFPAKDTIVKGQGIYTIMGGVLTKMDVDGSVEMVKTDVWGFDKIDYSEGVCWWRKGFDPKGERGILVLTENTKNEDALHELDRKKKKAKR